MDTKISLKRFDHVGIVVTDTERSIAFYKDILGLEPLPRPNFSFPGAWFSLGGADTLHLIEDKDQPTSSPRAHFALEADGIPEFAKHIAAEGLPHRGPQRRPDGALQFFVMDPDGNTVELTSDLP